jgi:murein L,D-transpeptidase YcbB/YkuD
MYLLQNDSTFSEKKIDSFMNASIERGVRLKPSIPVVISYYTAWVDDIGKLHFANDVYGNDKALAKKMFSIAKQ